MKRVVVIKQMESDDECFAPWTKFEQFSKYNPSMNIWIDFTHESDSRFKRN